MLTTIAIYRQYDHAPPRRPNKVQYLPAVPPDLPGLSTGYFALPPMDKYQVPKACIKDSAQSPAWSCDMPFRWYSVNVSRRHDAPPTNNYALNLTPFNRNSSKFIWGTQPPSIADAMPLRLAKDPDEMNRGPAWFLETNYTKAVVLPKASLQMPPSSPPSKRDSYVNLSEGAFNVNRFKQKMKTAVEGDEIWYCTWPNTQFQVFIYPNQTFATTTSSVGPDGMSPTPTPSAYATGYGGQEIKPPNTKSPYPKLVKFVERRQYTADFHPASCSLQKVINGGCNSEPVRDEHGNPVVINIAEISKSTMVPLAERSVADGSVSELQSRDVELTPCGCVSFSWNV